MANKHHLAALQLAIMHVLWDRGEATVADVRESLKGNRTLAHTTIATMLAKMERKGQVARSTDGRAHVFRPLIQQDQVSQSMVSDLVERLFGGDVTQLVSQLLHGDTVGPEELARLKALITAKEQEARDDD